VWELVNLLKRQLPVPNSSWRQALDKPESFAHLLRPQTLLGPREATKLLEEIGDEGYNLELEALLWQIVMRPGTVKRPPILANHPLWRKVGVEPGKEQSPGAAASAIVRVVHHFLVGPDGLQDGLKLVLGRTIRREHALSRGRSEETFSETEQRLKKLAAQNGGDASGSTWEPTDALSMRGYEASEACLDWEVVLSQSSSAQREAWRSTSRPRRLGRPSKR